MGNLGAQKEKRNDTPISAKKDIMGDKTVRVRADLHHIIKIETAKNGGNVKEVMEIRLRSKLKSVLIVHYLKILYNSCRQKSQNCATLRKTDLVTRFSFFCKKKESG